MKWIDVKDKLPVPKNRVLVTDGGSITIMVFDFGLDGQSSYGFHLSSESVMYDRSITHWMPFPKGPLKQKK